MWQEYRDEVSFAFTASENTLARNQQLAITAIANQFAMDMFEAQVDADAQVSMGALVGNLVQTVFSAAVNETGIFGDDDDSEET